MTTSEESLEARLLNSLTCRSQTGVSRERKKVIYNKGFSSGKYLYNFDGCKNSLLDYVIITEGVRDVMKLWQEGFDNAVAIFGCDIKKGQYNLLYELKKKAQELQDRGETR